jgi:hypothetical protein
MSADQFQSCNLSLAATSDELQPLLTMCREGRVYDVEQWVKDGKPLQLVPGAEPRGRHPYTAMEIALNSGQHSLTLLLLRSGYRLDLEKIAVLDTVLEKRRWDLFELLLEWGADMHSASPHVILETYNTELYERYLAAGYDFTKGHAIAGMLGYSTSNRPLYGFVKRHRSEDPKIQRELNMALCEHVREGKEKGVALCLWAGADPHTSVPSLRYTHSDDDEDDSAGWSAVEIAVSEDNIKFLEKYPPNPAKDDFDGFYRSAKSQSVVKLLAAISPPKDMGDILSWHLRWLVDRQFGFINIGGGMWTIEAILACGTVWRETDARTMIYIRQSLLKADEYDFKKLMRLFGNPGICAPETYTELIWHKKMKERMLALHLIKPIIPASQKRREGQNRLLYRYNREKLYEQIWAEPVQQVAKLYGISDVRLGKVCRILDIPVPPRGYWAKLRSGYKSRQPRLPKLKTIQHQEE